MWLETEWGYVEMHYRKTKLHNYSPLKLLIDVLIIKELKKINLLLFKNCLIYYENRLFEIIINKYICNINIDKQRNIWVEKAKHKIIYKIGK